MAKLEDDVRARARRFLFCVLSVMQHTFLLTASIAEYALLGLDVVSLVLFLA